MGIEVSFGLELAFKATVLLAVAFCVAHLFRRRPAAERHLLWVIATCGVLALPLLVGGVPTWHVSVNAPSWTLPPADRPDLVGPGVAPVVAGANRAEGESAVPAGTGVAWTVTNDAAAPSATVQPPTRLAESITPAAVVAVAWLLWLVGALAVAGALVVSFYRMHRIAARCRPVHDPALLDLVRETSAELAVHRPVLLLEGDVDAMPMTFGLFRSKLLLPSVARTWHAARQRAVLRHELAHIARRDAWTQLVAELCCVLHWYNPLVWLAARRMHIEREHACDDIVLAAGGRATDYAAELIGIARTMRTPRGTAVAAVAMTRDSQLRARTLALLDGRRRSARLSHRLLVPAWLGAFALVTTLASLAPEYARPSLPGAGEGAATARTLGASGAEAFASAALSPIAPVPVPVTAAPVSSAGASTRAPIAEGGSDCLSGSRSQSVHSNDTNGRRTIKWSGRDCSGEAVIDGEVEFDPSFTTITGISRGGEFRLEVVEGRDRRQLVMRAANGGVTYDYRRNNERLEFDAEARQWLNEQLLFLFRRVGFMAEQRAGAMLARGGYAAVLSEVEHLGSDHVRSVYLGVAVRDGRLDEQSLRRVLTLAGNTLTSDHYRTSVITAAAGRYEFTDGVRSAYIDAVSGINSDHYRHTAFSTLLQKGTLSPSQIASVLNESERIRSDHYRTQLLGELAGAYGMTPEIRPAYLRAAAGMSSDHYKHVALTSLLENGDLSAADQVGVVRAASTIRSDHYRRQLLSGVTSRRNLSPEVLTEVLQSARTISSDHHKSGLLIEIADAHALQGATRELMLDVMNDIRSSTYRGRVAEAMLRTGR